MKVQTLKKINEYAKNNKFKLDYEGLLKISTDDINKVLAFMDVDNSNVEDVFEFMTWELNNPNWIDKFQHLEGIENFDVREYLIGKMISANSKLISNLILVNFDFGHKSRLLNLFKTIEEWQTYIENIGEAMDSNEKLVFSNLEIVLEKATTDRCNLIKQVMDYSQRGDFCQEDLSEYYYYKNFDPYLNEILSLLIEGYNTEETFNLFNKWIGDIDVETDKVDDINHAYQNVINYLKESKLFNHLSDDESLICIFNKNNYLEYKNIILLLKEIEEKEDKVLFEKCLNDNFILSNSIMRDYARKILYAKEENNDYRESLLYLLNQKIIGSATFYEFEENIIKACNTLILSQEFDDTSMEMAKFIASVKYAGMVKNMKITQDNLDTREVLYESFPKFITESLISTNQIEYYADWLAKLSSLPSDICQKVMNIINIPLIKNMDIEKQDQIKELVLNPENFSALDYIYQQYQNKEEEYKRYEESLKIKEQQQEKYPPALSSPNDTVTLMTVSELLGCGYYDFDLVLDGFNDDDEITPKTLIRSLAYKNNQNN